MTNIPDGIYTYRFSGFSQDAANTQNYLVGIGSLDVAQNKVTSGEHHSTYMRVSGGGGEPVHTRFGVAGSFSWDVGKHQGSASLVFTQQGMSEDETQKLWGEFAFVSAGGPDRFWLISKAGTQVQNGRLPAEVAMEIVEGELVRSP